MNQENHSGDRSAFGRLAEAESLPLLTTKLYRPRVTPDMEQRTRLMERLKHNRHRPLTLISAPAGYGKTMLASMWLEACSCPSAWISLDETDNDLCSFTSYLLAALRTVFPTLELKTGSLLEAPVLPPAPVLAQYLLNDVEQIGDRFILALDDVHLIQEQAVLDFLSELLRHPSPSMSLVLIGRRDPPLPIASLRARRQVTEVRAGDLRFTPQEAAQLLGQVLRRDIDGATATEWTERTEGWVTGLLLAALSLRQRDQTDNVRLDVPEASDYLQDYLLAEVLAHLPPGRRDWLLLTSLLDRFCAPLCEVIGRSKTGAGPADRPDPKDRSGIEFIRWLQEDNLFLVPLDDRSQWFRFHHLFQQLLQDRLQRHLGSAKIAAAHRRVSNWFAENGLVQDALQHALAAGDVQTAVYLVEQHRYHLMNTEQWNRLDHWLKLLPGDAVTQSPFLMSARAFLSLQRGQDREMVLSLQEAERLVLTLSPEAAEVQVIRAELGVIQGLLDMAYGRAGRAGAGAQDSLKLLPPQALHIRTIAILVISLSLQMQGDLRQAIAVIREALADRTWPAGLHARMAHYICIAYFQEGDLVGVLRAAGEYLPVAQRHQVGDVVSYGRYNLGIAHYLRNEFAQAEPYLLALLEDRALSAPTYLTNGAIALALMYHALGRVSEADQVIDLLNTHLRETSDTFAWAMAPAIRVELALRQGKLSEARQLSKGVEFDLRPPLWFFYLPQLTPLKLLLAEGTAESLAEANARLAVLGAEMRRINRKNVLIDVLVLQALVCDAQGDEPAAMEKLHAALKLGIVGENIRSFVDLGTPMANLLGRYRQERMAGRRDALGYVDRILAAFGPGTDHEQPPTRSTTAPSLPSGVSGTEELIEPLTGRELEVLALLAQRQTYKEIGAQLFISAGTVSQHAVRIYRKLQVKNRRQAIVKAQALGILPQR